MAEQNDATKNLSEVMRSESKGGEFRITERYFSNDENLPSIGIANIHSIVPDIEANKAKMLHALEIFKEKEVTWAIFHEFCLSGYFWEDEEECWRYMDQAVIENHVHWVDDNLKSLIDDKLRGIVFNNIRKGTGRKYFNSTYVVSEIHNFLEPQDRYDKIFLPNLERKYTETGKDNRLVVETKFGLVGYTTCYDILFSQLLLEYSKIDRVDAITEIASWRAMSARDYPGMNVGTDTYYGSLWDMLLPATAAMNQVWIIACNAVGSHEISGARFWGGSGLWAPSGLLLLQASHVNEELLVVHNVDIMGQRKVEADDFNYTLDFDSIYRPIHGKRAFTRIDD